MKHEAEQCVIMAIGQNLTVTSIYSLITRPALEKFALQVLIVIIRGCLVARHRLPRHKCGSP